MKLPTYKPSQIGSFPLNEPSTELPSPAHVRTVGDGTRLKPMLQKYVAVVAKGYFPFIFTGAENEMFPFGGFDKSQVIAVT